MRLVPTSASVKKTIVNMSHAAGSNGAHIGSALSCVEIMLSIYAKFDFLEANCQDVFILSKGHAALCQYALLYEYGVLSTSDISAFNQDASGLFCHSKYDLAKRLSFSGGSLGLGLSYALGLAIHRSALNLPGKIVCMVGDGELDEGICWEAINLIGHKRLDNLLVIVDKNGMQSDGKKSDIIDSGSLTAKLKGFGIKAVECDGHSIDALMGSYHQFEAGELNFLVANTVKGNGIPFMQNNPDWHYGVVNEKVLQKINDDV